MWIVKSDQFILVGMSIQRKMPQKKLSKRQRQERRALLLCTLSPVTDKNTFSFPVTKTRPLKLPHPPAAPNFSPHKILLEDPQEPLDHPPDSLQGTSDDYSNIKPDEKETISNESDTETEPEEENATEENQEDRSEDAPEPPNNENRNIIIQETENQQNNMANITLSDSLTDPKTPAKPKFLCPPTFNPCSNNALSFMKTYERTAAANGWDEKLKIGYFETFLEGAAELWFQRYKTKADNEQKTWAELKKDFKKEFEGDETKRKQKPEESITAYYYELQTLFGEYDPAFDVENFRKFFENGINRNFYQNYRLILEDNIDWDGFKKIINKLEDISSEAQTNDISFNNLSLNETNILANPIRCLCSCRSQNPQIQTNYASNTNRQNLDNRNYGQRNPFQRYGNNFNGSGNQRQPIRNYYNYNQVGNRYQPRQPVPHMQRQQGNFRNNGGRPEIPRYNQFHTSGPRNQVPTTRNHDGRPRCYICNRLGHAAAGCRERPNHYPNDTRRHT
ncbi:hypothetical protein NQ317_018865 [Molorchus minor]|uniref:Retrotransposon gag domain-containing protein n=1 Tax=Molorchus minor TaxID=1323400 RepID=A0ABQ9JE74_9CUCU|nr:hypothetical protein NQ317_018865 [Molorchus minor]